MRDPGRLGDQDEDQKDRARALHRLQIIPRRKAVIWRGIPRPDDEDVLRQLADEHRIDSFLFFFARVAHVAAIIMCPEDDPARLPSSSTPL
jgi:hypothetical protein